MGSRQATSRASHRLSSAVMTTYQAAHREVLVALDKKYFLLTGKNGVLDTTTTGDIDETFRQLGTQSNIIFYFHGGLVSKRSGLDGAARLLPRFLSNSVYPVFFVYESGFLEIVSRNLTDIAGED